MDDRSLRFAERLFAAHPEWLPFARADPEGFPPPGSLLVEVQSPVPGRALMIRTYGEQVTIDFGPRGWHDHFGPLNSENEEEVFRRALEFIEDLIAERVVIITRVIFGWAAWSRAVRISDFRPPRLGAIEVYSWTGKPIRLWTDCREVVD